MITVGTSCKITRDIVVEGQVAFREGEIVTVAGISPDPQRPENKYVVTSSTLQTSFKLSDKDLAPQALPSRIRHRGIEWGKLLGGIPLLLFGMLLFWICSWLVIDAAQEGEWAAFWGMMIGGFFISLIPTLLGAGLIGDEIFEKNRHVQYLMLGGVVLPVIVGIVMGFIFKL